MGQNWISVDCGDLIILPPEYQFAISVVNRKLGEWRSPSSRSRQKGAVLGILSIVRIVRSVVRFCPSGHGMSGFQERNVGFYVGKYGLPDKRSEEHTSELQSLRHL